MDQPNITGTQEFRSVSTEWGTNTVYPIFPTKSPIEEMAKGYIESVQETIAPLNAIIYKPGDYLTAVYERPADQITYLLGSIIAIFSCFAITYIRQPFYRQLFGTLVGLFLNFYVFGFGACLILSFNLLVYLLISVAPRKHLPLTIFLLAGALLAGFQIHKQVFYFGRNGLDVNMCLMGAYSKLTTLACNLKDGDEVKKARNKKEKPDLKSREIQYAVEETPSLFEFVSYLNFAGSSISGPWFEYKDLMQMYRKEGHYKDIDTVSTFWPGLYKFLQGLGCIALGSLLSTQFDLTHTLSSQFASYNLPYQLWYVYGCLKCEMQTFMVGFCLMEAGPVMCGLGWSGKDEHTKKDKHNRVPCANMWDLEVSSCVKDFLAAWNMAGQQWLKYYVYLRLLPNDKEQSRNSLNVLPIFITSLVSATWHGFYSGYFMFFAGVAILDIQSKLAGKVLGPLLTWCPDVIQNMIAWIYLYAYCGYFFVGFLLLNSDIYNKAYASMNYALHYSLVITLSAFVILNKVTHKPKKVDKTD